MTIVKIYVFLLIYFYSVDSSLLIICEGNQTIYLEPKKVFFIESPNFPQRMKEDCEINFMVQNYQDYQDFFVQLSLTNDQLFSNFNVTPSYIDDDNETSFEFYHRVKELKFETTIDENYNAFQAMVFLEILQKNDGCPFQSVPLYNFTNESEILSISSLYAGSDGIDLTTNPVSIVPECTWKFTAPYDYKFKLVVASRQFQDSNPNASVTFDNGVDVIVFDGSTNFEIFGTHLTIHFDPSEFAQFADILFPFSFQICIEQIDPLIKEENCTVSKNGNVTIWTNFDKNMMGYSSNSQCSFHLVVPWENEILVNFVTHDLTSGDTISTYVNNVLTELYLLYPIFLQSKKDGQGRDVLFKFASDGNMQSLGFKFTFEEKKCECGSSVVVVPCEGTLIFNVMQSKDGHFCNYLSCNFTITIDQKCKTNNIWFQIDLTDIQIYGVSMIRVFSGNSILFDSDKDYNDYRRYSMLLVSNVIHTLTFNSNDRGLVNFVVNSENPVTILPSIILNSSRPSYFLDVASLPGNSAISIKLDETLIATDILEMYAYSISDLLIYTDETFLTPYKFNVIDGKMPLPTNYVTIYLHERNSRLIFFHALYAHSKNCLLGNNVFYKHYETGIVSMISKPTAVCEIVIMTETMLTDVWTTSNSSNIQIFTAYGKPLFEFNKDDAHEWKNMALNMHFYVVQIPASASIAFYFEDGKDPFDPFPFLHKTLWSSRNYDQHRIDSFKDSKKFYVGENVSATVTIIDIFSKNSTTLNDQKVWYIGQTFFFMNETFEIKYIPNNDNRDNGILIEIEITP